MSDSNLVSLKRLPAVAFSIALALGALLLLSASVQAAAARLPPAPAPANLPAALVITVTSGLDAPDDFYTDTICHTTLTGHPCTLRAAVQTLDHHGGGTIVLASTNYTLTDDPDGDLQLQKDIKIVGSAGFYSLITGKPGWKHRLLRVQSGARVTLTGLTLSNGNVVTGTGGALDVVSGTATLDSVFLEFNSALAGGAIYNRGTLVLNKVFLAANRAISDGGAIYNAGTLGFDYNLTITLGNFVENGASGNGGALFNVGKANLQSSQLSFNAADNGGGAANLAPGSLYIESTSFWTNQAVITGQGGGLYNDGVGALVQMANSTVASNTASEAGGGLSNIRGDVDLASDTIADNISGASHPVSGGAGGGLFNGLGTVRLANTLVGANADLTNHAPDCGGTYDSLDYNLVQSVTGCTLTDQTAHTITGTSPLLGPVGFYSGSLMVPLTLFSPAVDAAKPGPIGCNFGLLPLVFDERGAPRTVDGNGDGVARCDIGAFELQPLRLFLPAITK